MLEFLDIIHLFCTELRRLKIGGFCKLNSNPAKATEERSLSICQSSADDNQPSRTLEHLCIAIPDHLDFESQASSYLLDLIPRRYRYLTTLEIHDINWIKRDVHDEKYLVTKVASDSECMHAIANYMFHSTSWRLFRATSSAFLHSR